MQRLNFAYKKPSYTNVEVKYGWGLIVKRAICDVISPLDVTFLHLNKFQIPCTASVAGTAMQY